ncbi:MAG: sulfatase-like hydrolase/transferase [Gammaproteobacteria bacterium]|nr:sulfatase-like hydrolase/transferase [Gammaproteobacteria bacterium]
MLVFMSLARLGFFVWQFDRIEATGQYGFIFLQGLRIDAVLIAIAMILPAILTPFFCTRLGLFKFWRKFFLLYMTVWFIFIVFMELSTPSFINQYDSRPNYLFVEYLGHYKEVGATLLAEYPLQLLFAVIVVPIVGRGFYKLAQRLLILDHPIHWPIVILLVPVLFFSFLFIGRSTLGHRAVNPSTVAITADHMVNDLALNSAYTVLYAVYQSRLDEQGGRPYQKMPFEQVVSIVRKEMLLADDAFTSNDYPTRHHQVSVKPLDRPYNIVIILQESLGAEFVGKLGGLPLTPHIDALADEGVWFNNLYATGTRSVRGIEAVVAGFLPTPARSVVKLNKSQRDFFTIASYLKKKGYDTGFIYGGESHFDNMRSFFMGNGFSYVIDKNDYPDDAFMATWGVCDEDLFTIADKKFSDYDDEPFFSLIFTSTNHSPFEFPSGRIALYDKKTHTVNNAVKYADYAVGEFIKKAKKSSYWENTLFLIIADHNSRVYGSSLVPVERFHIPALILGGPIAKSNVISTLASQIDIAPTLLSMAGISGEHPMVGRDLSQAKYRNATGRAIMQFNDVLAYMEEDNVVILRYNMSPKLFKYAEGNLTEQSGENPTLASKALAYSLFAQIAYSKQLY